MLGILEKCRGGDFSEVGGEGPAAGAGHGVSFDMLIFLPSFACRLCQGAVLLSVFAVPSFEGSMLEPHVCPGLVGVRM